MSGGGVDREKVEAIEVALLDSVVGEVESDGVKSRLGESVADERPEAPGAETLPAMGQKYDAVDPGCALFPGRMESRAQGSPARADHGEVDRRATH